MILSSFSPRKTLLACMTGSPLQTRMLNSKDNWSQLLGNTPDKVIGSVSVPGTLTSKTCRRKFATFTPKPGKKQARSAQISRKKQTKFHTFLDSYDIENCLHWIPRELAWLEITSNPLRVLKIRRCLASAAFRVSVCKPFPQQYAAVSFMIFMVTVGVSPKGCSEPPGEVGNCCDLGLKRFRAAIFGGVDFV